VHRFVSLLVADRSSVDVVIHNLTRAPGAALDGQIAAAIVTLLQMPQELARLREEVQHLREELRVLKQDDRGQLLTAKQAAKLLSMTESALLVAARRGTIPCVHLGRRVRFRREDLAMPASSTK
jgi:excisionase family DNA binding protein